MEGEWLGGGSVSHQRCHFLNHTHTLYMSFNLFVEGSICFYKIGFTIEQTKYDVFDDVKWVSELFNRLLQTKRVSWPVIPSISSCLDVLLILVIVFFF